MPEKRQWIEPANNILIPLWKINFFTIHSTPSEKNGQNEVDCACSSHNQISNFVCNQNSVALVVDMKYFIPHSQGFNKKSKQCQSGWTARVQRKKVSHVRTEQFSPPLHARYCNGSKKSFQSALRKLLKKNSWMTEKKKMKFALLTIVDAFLWFYVATRCRKKCDLQCWECHSVWINCIIINTRGQVDVIAVVMWIFLWFFYIDREIKFKRENFNNFMTRFKF